MIIKPTKIYGLEWYDGWIASILQVQSKWLACIVVSIDWDANQRRFVLATLEENEAMMLLKVWEESGLCEIFVDMWCLLFNREGFYTTDTEPTLENTLRLDELVFGQTALKAFNFRLPAIDLLT